MYLDIDKKDQNFQKSKHLTTIKFKTEKIKNITTTTADE
jgi:hypothetical protein